MILEGDWYKDVLDILSSLAAAAIATFVTVREMRKGRKDMLNPDLYIEQKTIEIVWKDIEKDRYYFLMDKPSFNLYNLGNDPA